tara:strand:+ start:1164 stop:1319 length:156 start_codon:yes stop_codon:yes gene_type:complete
MRWTEEHTEIMKNLYGENALAEAESCYEAGRRLDDKIGADFWAEAIECLNK